eukprot:400341_1
MKIPLYKSKINENMKVKVIGYPGEEKIRGELYGMIGNGQVKYVNIRTQYNKLIAYDIDTSAGQSGSPVFKVGDIDNKENDEKECKDNIYKSFGDIIGIHVAGKRSKKLNFGTMLNDEIIKWTHECTDGDCKKYDDYQVSVLLITSSKSKYARKLNQIYAKCKKIEIMQTRKLYYEYGDEENVNKEEVLFYMKQMFKQVKTAYLIFYCGDSDENGNWIINNNKYDNITLEDISICAKGKPENVELVVISDCSQSGNWVTLKKSNANKFKNVNTIQASSKENEACNAGTFTSKYAQCCFGYGPTDKKHDKMGKGKLLGIGVGTVVVGGLGTLTVASLYDGVIKQPYHKATKQSQPTMTGHGPIIGYSRDQLYEIYLVTFDSWYSMDACITVGGSISVGSGGNMGLY